LNALIGPNILVGLAVALGFSLALVAVPRLKRAPSLCAMSLIGAGCYYWREFAGFLLVILVAYAVTRWLRQVQVSRRWRRACIALLSLVVIFTLGRLRHWDKLLTLPAPAALVLYSLDMWLALRLVTLLWEVGSGLVDPPFLSYITWVCLPLTVVGPILRYSQMPAELYIDRAMLKSMQWWMGLAAGSAKLAVGVGLAVAQQWISGRWGSGAIGTKAMTALLTGPISFYLVTAGYFQLMEVFGRPCGFKLPMSFSYPIGRENISAFWMNWNMTATFVFRDYLFYNRWGFQSYNIYLNTVLLFTLVGLWHAANAYWILWGLLHGVLFCLFLLWKKYNNRIHFLPFRGTVLAGTAARVLTYVSVCACWYLPSKILQKLAFA
jgi:D-alanyl-lipoteichoic acid acyltransferase DltB (MBOAT superfamily)